MLKVPYAELHWSELMCQQMHQIPYTMKFCCREIFFCIFHKLVWTCKHWNCNCQSVACASTQCGQWVVETKPQEFGVASLFRKYPCKNVNVYGITVLHMYSMHRKSHV